MQLERTVCRSRLEQQHRDVGVFAQARGEGCSRRARPDDDVVRLEIGAPPAPPITRTSPRQPPPSAARHAPKAFTSTTDMAAQLPSMRNRVKPSQTAAPVRDVTNHGGFGSTDRP